MPDVTAAHLDTLRRIHTDLAARMSESWTRRFRFRVDVGVNAVDHTTMGAFVETLENPCCAYTFGIGLEVGPAGLSYARAVAEAIIAEQLKGRTDLGLKPGEPMSMLHRRIMGPIITRELEDFERAWGTVKQVQVSDAEIEVDPACLDVALPGAGIVRVTFSIESGKISGEAHLAYPLSTLEPVLNELS